VSEPGARVRRDPAAATATGEMSAPCPREILQALETMIMPMGGHSFRPGGQAGAAGTAGPS
jgi:hypothetical protein